MISSAFKRLSFCAALVIASPLIADAPAAGPSAPKTAGETVRHTVQGDVIGFVGENDTYVWRGIPFAAPPVGNLRWRAPRPAAPWQGVRRATEFSPSCIQSDGELMRVHTGFLTANDYLKKYKSIGSEDCLYLNVRAPKDVHSAEGKKLPVMVYIHPNGNVWGSGAPVDDVTAKLVSGQNVVSVTMNYRLGHMGFFTHPALRSSSDSAEDRSGNYGLLDQIAALRWVKDNIASFGGDPRNVIIYGTSAGGWDCLALMSSPVARGLFQKAIPMSAGTMTRSVAQATDYIESRVWDTSVSASSGEILLRLLMADGKASDRSSAKKVVSDMSQDAIARYLRGKTFDEIMQADAQIVEQDFPSVLGMPIRDGYVIPKEGIAATFARLGNRDALPILIGATRDEDQPGAIRDRQFAESVKGLTGDEYRFTDKAGYRLVAEYMSMVWNADGAQERAAELSKTHPGKVFAYQLTFDKYWPWPGPDQEPRGAIHASDIPFYFGLPAVTKPGVGLPVRQDAVPGYVSLSDAMMSYWGEFAYTGRPGKGRRGELPEWLPWSNKDGAQKYMVLDTPADGGFQMATNYLTKAAVFKKLELDERLPTIKEKCAFLVKLMRGQSNYGRVSPRDFNNFAGGACRRAVPN